MRATRNNGHACTPLGDVLDKSEDWIDLNPLETYTEVSVRLWGKGVVARGQRLGSEIGSSRRLRVHPRQFILSRIDARNGAFGLVPEDLDGAVVSNDFPAFDTDEERLLPEYLGWLSRTRTFLEQCKAVSEGTTNRVRLKEDKFYEIDIPLPPLDEQQQIVAKIEQLAAKIDEANVLRERSSNEIVTLNTSLLSAAVPADVPRRPLGELIDPDTRLSYGVLKPGPDVEGGVPFVRVGDLSVKNTQARPQKSIGPAIDSQYERTRLNGGEVLIAVVGSIGKVGIAPASWAGANIARAVARIVAGPNIHVDYLVSVLQSEEVQHYLLETTRTLAQPTLNIGQLKEAPIPVPPLEEQRRIVTYLNDLKAKVDRLKTLQQQTAAELDALLPSILDKAFKGEL